MSTNPFVGNIVESNGKTWKENNLAKSHNITLGTLVEVYWENGDYNGVRMFVVSHDRDYDGTPLYSLSFNKNAEAERIEDQRLFDNTREDPANRGSILLSMYHGNLSQTLGSILTGITEDNLTVIHKQYSNVKPEVPGYYWCRGGGWSPRVISIKEDDDELFFYEYNGDDFEYWGLLSEITDEFEYRFIEPLEKGV